MVINQLLTRMIQVVSQDPLFFQLSFVFILRFSQQHIDFEHFFCCPWIRSFYPQVSRWFTYTNDDENPTKLGNVSWKNPPYGLRISWSQGPTKSERIRGEPLNFRWGSYPAEVRCISTAGVSMRGGKSARLGPGGQALRWGPYRSYT